MNILSKMKHQSKKISIIVVVLLATAVFCIININKKNISSVERRGVINDLGKTSSGGRPELAENKQQSKLLKEVFGDVEKTQKTLAQEELDQLDTLIKEQGLQGVRDIMTSYLSNVQGHSNLLDERGEQIRALLREHFIAGNLGSFTELWDAIYADKLPHSIVSSNLVSFIFDDIYHSLSLGDKRNELIVGSFRDIVENEPRNSDVDITLQVAAASADVVGVAKTLEILDNPLSNGHQGAVAKSLIESWYIADSLELSKYIAKMPTGETKDAFITIMVGKLVETRNYGEAEAWINTLPNETQKILFTNLELAKQLQQ